ncbi:hypothetical protein MAPG_07303 [Magnaporthiopsis poae ATCC 64411]|uniref:Uncharacterized protein n=1 Tax=Magnaporthiopsis poae (strain ATCC 64411 / 73-15) TaxID=644358 RepID=A0A0C4E4B1_MAGP6|nr:hypothetical protein MAPG_07303 [Magnaporthiopsis poae ATCC 64411]
MDAVLGNLICIVQQLSRKSVGRQSVGAVSGTGVFHTTVSPEGARTGPRPKRSKMEISHLVLHVGADPSRTPTSMHMR